MWSLSMTRPANIAQSQRCTTGKDSQCPVRDKRMFDELVAVLERDGKSASSTSATAARIVAGPDERTVHPPVAQFDIVFEDPNGIRRAFEIERQMRVIAPLRRNPPREIGMFGSEFVVSSARRIPRERDSSIARSARNRRLIRRREKTSPSQAVSPNHPHVRTVSRRPKTLSSEQNRESEGPINQYSPHWAREAYASRPQFAQR